MNTKEFIYNRLDKLSKVFPEVQFSYEHRALPNTHVIEVLPLAFFENNAAYLDAEFLLESEFHQLFPEEEILFVSEESLIQVEEPECVFGFHLFSFESDSVLEFDAHTPIEESYTINTPVFAFAA